jgi:cytochrome c553
MPYMSMWSMNPDGSNARLVYKNFTKVPHCTFEPQSIPGSSKILFTASGHHAQTMGSLVMLNPAAGTEGTAPITRLTPEVVFPEIEGWSGNYFANPQPLSERTILVCWGQEETVREGTPRVANGMGLYVFDAVTGNLELLYRDPKITCGSPIAVQTRTRPPALASTVNWNGPREGRLLLTDVYRGLKTVQRGDIKALRIVAVVPKTHPTMDNPSMGLTRDDTGKMVLGTVPVEEDGSAFFRLPAGVIVFFQALDGRGMAVQTMRSVTYVQPGQTQSCVGCHESRIESPQRKPALASRREASKIAAGPEGSWPYRFDRMIQPMLDRSCVSCHAANGKDPAAARFVLTADKAYESLTKYGSPSLYDHVWERYRPGRSIEGAGAAAQSAALKKTLDAKVHPDLKLDADSLERLIVWMDVMAQKQGSFDPQQEQYLAGLRDQWADMMIEGKPKEEILSTKF